MNVTPLPFQEIILKLQEYWGRQGCVVLQPYDVEVGAGTFHPATTLRSLGPAAWAACYVQPSRRPGDGRYGDNPNRVYQHHQFQVVIKPSPLNIQDLYIDSLVTLGIDSLRNDIRFLEDDWESPTLGAAGLGWEVWCNGQEITQFTYFQQMGGFTCDPVMVELTYGLERLAMALQDCTDVKKLAWNAPSSKVPFTWGDIFQRNEQEFSAFNFEQADTVTLLRQFDDMEQMCQSLLNKNLALPAYDHCIKASHIFNLLEARGVISVTERAHYIGRVRALARGCCQAYLHGREACHEG